MISALLVSAPNPDTLAVLRLTLRQEPFCSPPLETNLAECWRSNVSWAPSHLYSRSAFRGLAPVG